jgi:hypothetical protein
MSIGTITEELSHTGLLVGSMARAQLTQLVKQCIDRTYGGQHFAVLAVSVTNGGQKPQFTFDYFAGAHVQNLTAGERSGK